MDTIDVGECDVEIYEGFPWYDTPVARRQRELRESGMTWLEVIRATRMETGRAMLPDDRIHRPVVYYMRMDGLVKIGTSKRIAARFRTLRPQGILAVEWGDQDLERERHNQFAADHSHGEWFWLTESTWGHIAGLRAKPRFHGSLSMDEWLQLWMSAPVLA